jgi:acetyl-CoA acyltransferase
MSDGAGAVVLMSEAAMKRFNATPMGRFLGFAVAGVPPDVMGIGPVKAIPKVLAQAGLKQDALDWIELNEAFAAQSLAVIRELGLDPAKVNPQGGAIALGHPLGAAGARIRGHLAPALAAAGERYALGSAGIGGGQGIAVILENVNAAGAGK